MAASRSIRTLRHPNTAASARRGIRTPRHPPPAASATPPVGWAHDCVFPLVGGTASREAGADGDRR
ncbi:hypothetical protein [Rathayibacter soli]|uniref:hypothetical protein n=1 Tax=Rathayibacter soli TaxID=3144168 RepID=UPI0027E3D860|nr:hypothetical protein [Glaciibacter superstes]